MALVTCGGSDVLRARVHMPRRGAWWAEMHLDTATAPAGSVTLAADGGLSLAGTVVQGGVFLDTARVRVVAGAGGLGKQATPDAFQSAQLRDPLNALARDSGETLASIDDAILSVNLTDWCLVAAPVRNELERLCGAAGAALGAEVVFRFTDDGKLWLGLETWPSASLPTTADVIDQFPEERRYVIGAETPTLEPGVNLSDISANVLGVDHWIDATQVRSWLWT